jgi:hypothetical protein
MKNTLKVLHIILVLAGTIHISAGEQLNDNDSEIYENPEHMKYLPLTKQEHINDKLPENATRFQQTVALLMHRLANPLLAIEMLGIN